MNAVLVLAAFWLPRLAFGAAIRLRGWTLAVAAPALTFGLVALGIESPRNGTIRARAQAREFGDPVGV